MTSRDESIQQIEQYIQKLDRELTPRTPFERRLILESIIRNLGSDGIELEASAHKQCERYISGEITMRDLSEYLLPAARSP